ncbi:MAG: Hsp20/alpha crystallin family protein [Planctomycetota bacterium]|nr:Hsp20/alpha crystallin family protein [Planctomycetota bacterium]
MAVYGKFLYFGGEGSQPVGADAFADAVNSPDAWEPVADVVEVDGGLLVHIDLPGVDRESLEVTVDGTHLVVRGVRRRACPGGCRRYIRMEITRGAFGKVIPLPEPVMASECTARLGDGVLEVFAPFGKKPAYAVAAVRIIKSEE